MARSKLIIAVTFLAALLGSAGAARAQAPAAQEPPAIADPALEDLMKVEVTSVSKKAEQLFRAPSAIYVLTRAEIRRSGATTIPEALRLVPGLSVAQIDGGQWAITARGFNGIRANKLLVMIDGRTVNTPTFSGVYWDAQSIPLEEVERIEVIRGPGGTLWGANAVNGVINIISREAFDTQGGYATAGGGSLEQGFGSVRYGGPLGPKSYYRIYGKYLNRGGTVLPDTAGDAGDQWHLLQGGFRADLRLTANDALMLSGSAVDARMGQRSLLVTGVGASELTTEPTKAVVRSFVASWTRKRSSQSSMSLTGSFQDSNRRLPSLTEDYDVLDIDFQHRLRLGQRHDVVWGAGQRLWADQQDGTFMLKFVPEHHRGHLANAFVQDEVAVRDNLNLLMGTKLEHDEISGLNAQPSVRLSWTPTARQNTWTAVSRAQRAPARADRDIRVNYATVQPTEGLPVLFALLGSSAFKPETVTAYEAGYRIVLPLHLEVDATAFYSRYGDLRQEVPVTFVETDPAPVHLVIGRRITNHERVITTGTETTARWNALSWWTLDASYSWFHANFVDNDGDDLVNGASPAHQWRFASGTDLPFALRLDLRVLRVGALDAFQVPGYTLVDGRLSHEFNANISLSIVGQNMLEAQHQEFGTADGVTATAIPRSAYMKLTWQF